MPVLARMVVVLMYVIVRKMGMKPIENYKLLLQLESTVRWIGLVPQDIN